LNDLRRTKQARPEPGHPDQQGPVTAAQSKTRRCTPQGDAKLMAKEQVLRFKPARRLEEVDDEHCERMQEREHRPRSCDDSTRRCDSQAGRDFRKGQDHDARISIMARANTQGPDTLPQTCLRPTRTNPLADRGRAIHSVHTGSQQTIEGLERNRRQDKEVDRRDALRMVAEKCPPVPPENHIRA